MTLLIVQEHGGFPLALVVFLRRVEGAELVVPLCLEPCCHEAVVGIDAEIAPLGELHLVACSLHLLAAQPVGVLSPSLWVPSKPSMYLARTLTPRG